MGKGEGGRGEGGSGKGEGRSGKLNEDGTRSSAILQNLEGIVDNGNQ